MFQENKRPIQSKTRAIIKPLVYLFRNTSNPDYNSLIIEKYVIFLGNSGQKRNRKMFQISGDDFGAQER